MNHKLLKELNGYSKSHTGLYTISGDLRIFESFNPTIGRCVVRYTGDKLIEDYYDICRELNGYGIDGVLMNQMYMTLKVKELESLQLIGDGFYDPMNDITYPDIFKVNLYDTPMVENSRYMNREIKDSEVLYEKNITEEMIYLQNVDSKRLTLNINGVHIRLVKGIVNGFKHVAKGTSPTIIRIMKRTDLKQNINNGNIYLIQIECINGDISIKTIFNIISY